MGSKRGLLFLFALGCVIASAETATVNVGMSTAVDLPLTVRRIAISSGDIAEPVVATPKEILLNGKKPGQTTLTVWLEDGSERSYNVMVVPQVSPLDAIRQQIQEHLPGQAIRLEMTNGVPIVSGTVKDLTSADRVLALASVLGRPVNLLNVEVPDTEPQVLLKIRFADVDRTASLNLGANLFTNGTGHTIGGTSTQQFSQPTAPTTLPVNGQAQSSSTSSGSSSFSLSDALNIFLYRTDLNLGATIQALQARSLLQILAEPNLLTLNKQTASFLAGGEFPFPTLQGGGAGLGAVTIQFREFGIRLVFTPYITPRGTIRLVVAPEVSSLDYSNALTVQGYTIPALSTRRVSTEVELQSGQSFAIAGLLDNQITQTLNKIPGLSNIPLIGKLFESIQKSKSNSELLILVTPEIVQPIPAGQRTPDVHMPEPFMPPNTQGPLRTPPESVTGPVPPREIKAIPMEELIKSSSEGKQNSSTQQQSPSLQFVPMMMPSGSQSGPVNPQPAGSPN